MIQNPEPYLSTAGGKIRCRRCKAQSSRTKLQCFKPALKGKAVCGHHGGNSTGPKTKAGKDRIRAAHFKHGDETLEAKTQRSENNLKLRLLIDLGNALHLFGKELKHLGRPPLRYIELRSHDFEQIFK